VSGGGGLMACIYMVRCVCLCGEAYVYLCRACVWCLMACVENVMCVCKSVVRHIAFVCVRV